MAKKYNRRGNAKQRYYAEWRDNRVFNSYLTSKWDFNGDKAQENGYKSWQLKHIPSFERVFIFRGVQYFRVMKNGY